MGTSVHIDCVVTNWQPLQHQNFGLKVPFYDYQLYCFKFLGLYVKTLNSPIQTETYVFKIYLEKFHHRIFRLFVEWNVFIFHLMFFSL